MSDDMETSEQDRMDEMFATEVEDRVREEIIEMLKERVQMWRDGTSPIGVFHALANELEGVIKIINLPRIIKGEPNE